MDRQTDTQENQMSYLKTNLLIEAPQWSLKIDQIFKLVNSIKYKIFNAVIYINKTYKIYILRNYAHFEPISNNNYN